MRDVPSYFCPFVYLDLKCRKKEERGNVPLNGVCSFKALSCRVSFSGVSLPTFQTWKLYLIGKFWISLHRKPYDVIIQQLI